MKLLLDHNLSPLLCAALRDVWPEMVHVRDVALQTAADPVVREYAARHGFIIVTKDSDFNNLAFLHGAPPKVVWIQLGNCSTADIEALLRSHHADLDAFGSDSAGVLLVLA